MSKLSAPNTQSSTLSALVVGWKTRMLQFLGRVGRTTRAQVSFSLIIVAASWGVLRENLRLHAWRRTVRAEFWASMRRVTGGGLVSTLFIATLAGLGVVSQAVYWLGLAGLTQMTGSILVTVLVREIAPVLVGVILLGRDGLQVVTELGMLTSRGQVRHMQTLGLDPFSLFVLPRTLAFTVSGFTLGMIFALTSLLVGYITSLVSGAINMPVWAFLYDVVNSMKSVDFVVIPMKFILVGFFVGLTCCMTGLVVDARDDVERLLPRGFSRGIMIVMIVNVLFSLVA